MTLEPGQKLTHYRLVAPIGEGGMGVVWSAIDTTLDRRVAIKVLPGAWSADGERLARFEREAKVLASLHHSHIASIFGFHATETGERFIAMELVEGVDLKHRLQVDGALPLDQAIAVADQVAAALEVAHESGVVHRDLKPANIKIRSDGQVKVLDFGLAKGLAPTPISGEPADPSLSPTLTSAGTVAGAILGTAAYMSPEQSKGLPVDQRTDIWAFGCVLWECITGRRVFAGETIPEILAEVIKSEPDLSLLPPETPSSVRRLLRRCLEKDPNRRLRHIGDARLELAEAADESEATGLPADAGSRRPIGPIAAAFATLALIAGGLVGYWIASSTRDEPAAQTPGEPLRAAVTLPADTTLAFGSAPIGYDSTLLALSPDGRWMIYAGRTDGGGSMLYRRELASFDPPRPIPGTEGAIHPFFAPDGSAIGFLTGDRVKRVSLAGDPPIELASANSAIRATWADDGYIYFAEHEGSTISRVPAAGGREEADYRTIRGDMTDILPGGRTALITEPRQGIAGDWADIGLLDLESGEIRILVEGGYDGRLLANDKILYGRSGNLLVVDFDRERGVVTGEPTTVVRGVQMDSLFLQVQVAVSESGTLAYLPGGDRALGRIASVDRTGQRQTLDVEPRLYGAVDLDGDDRRLAVHLGGVVDAIWIYDLERREETFINSTTRDGWPRWSRDSRSIAYSTWRKSGDRALMIYDLDTRARTELGCTTETITPIAAKAWTPDDSTLLFAAEGGIQEGCRIADSSLLGLELRGALPDLSPDGRWIVFSRTEAGVNELLVQPWLEPGPVHHVGNGIEPRWTESGEIFYRSGKRWYRVEVDTSNGFRSQPPELLFEVDFVDTPGTSYDATSDGRTFYLVEQATPAPDDRIHVVSDWLTSLP